MKYTGLILDIDGTIWNTTEIVAQAWNKAFSGSSKKVKPVTAEILQGQFGKPMDVIANNLFPELEEDERKRLLEECCLQEHIFIERNERNIMYPGVYDAVKKLSTMLPLFIVSNCQAGYIQLTLKKTGLTECITDFICFGDNTLSKADNIKLIVERNKIQKPLYAGDTQGDCDSCSEAGVDFAWASYGFGTADNYVCKLDKLSDLIDFLAD